MPEYPDITVYIERLRFFVKDQTLTQIRLANPFLVRTADPAINTLSGQTISDLERMGKRIVFCFPQNIYLILHLMISGRLYWQAPDARIPAKRGLAALDFAHGTLLITETSTKKRASLHLISGKADLAKFDRGGIEVLTSSLPTFRKAIMAENHTLKRTLTDPRILSGIGNAYSDEILHEAKLSPILLSQKLSDEQVSRLYKAIRSSLSVWTDRLREEVGDGFPEKVTAFRDDMAVHGRYGKPCPACGQKIQRIRYASNETNYCPRCQTGGRLLADRALSRLLKKDWPRTAEELEEKTGG